MQRSVGLLFALAACGGDPADVAGTYTINVTNGANGCGLPNYTEGESSSGVGVIITQDSDRASADVQGLAALGLDLLLGAHTFTGEVEGDSLDLQILGTRATTEGNCTFTYNADLGAEIDGDLLTGSITYRPATNGNPDCASRQGCTTVQAFNGARPPR